MSEIGTRVVTHTKTNRYGEITHICNPTMPWKEIKVEDAISHIANMMYSYVIKTKYGAYVPLKVKKDASGKKVLVSEDEDAASLKKLPGLY